MVLQLWAAGAATVLAIRDRFAAVAGAYIAGAVAGLVTFLALMSRAGVQTLGWSMIAMAVVTCAMDARGHRHRRRPRRRAALPAAQPLLKAAGLVLGGTAIYLAFNVLFVITLAFASHGAPVTPPCSPTPICSPATWWPVRASRWGCRASPT